MSRLQGLNDAQRRAVQHRGSGLLVLAGAGTGKTRVITHRIAEILRDGVAGNQIMAVTFTNKAAKEMRERLGKMGVGGDPWIGTFHAIGLRILRMHGDLLGYKRNFTIYDDDAQKALVKALLADTDLKGQKPTEGLIHHYIQGFKSKDQEPAKVEHEDSEVPKPLRRIVKEVYERYEEALKRSNAMDFSDLLVNTVRLLRQANGTPAAWLVRRFKHVLVDEFQDTNQIQMDMVDLLASEGEICVVGDDDQCLVRGTLVTMEDGTHKPIEEVQVGDRVLSCYGRGVFRGAKVTDVFTKVHTGHLVKIITSSGRVLVSTPEHTHFAGFRLGESPQTYVRNVTVTLCGDSRGSTPMHTISVTGNDEEEKSKLTELGFSVRKVKNGASSWRVEACCKDFPHVQEQVAKLQTAYKFNVILLARLAGDETAKGSNASLPFIQADSVMPGMVVFGEDGNYDVVSKVESVEALEQVHDINVEGTHNFIANGVVTHNSIYGWRGADPDGMMRFSKRPGVQVVKLEENYRCTASILDCANRVIARNTGRIGKTLRANKQGDLVRVTRVSDERNEAQAVAAAIKQPWGSHAILYRTHAQSRPLEEGLRLRGIPYTIIGGLRFYDRAEVKDVLAYLRLAVNPLADMDLLRVANKPTRGMGPKKMGALKTLAAKREQSLFETLKDADEKAVALRQLLLDLATARASAITLLDFYEEVMRLTGYRDFLVRTATSSKSAAQREKAQTQIDNVDELANDLASYSSERSGATIDDYLEHVSLASSFDKEGGPVVSLMTIHAAKGLEFPHVHLVGFEDKLLPHLNSLSLEDPKARAAAIEEERRLAYVAITRAMERLDITLTKMRSRQGRPEPSIPSRFLGELPQGRYKAHGL